MTFFVEWFWERGQWADNSIDTARIYIMTTGTEHRRKIERLGLVV